MTRFSPFIQVFFFQPCCTDVRVHRFCIYFIFVSISCFIFFKTIPLPFGSSGGVVTGDCTLGCCVHTLTTMLTVVYAPVIAFNTHAHLGRHLVEGYKLWLKYRSRIDMELIWVHILEAHKFWLLCLLGFEGALQSLYFLATMGARHLITH